ncbi:membrane protein insertase YidC [Patescibacteria group bacterium]|nr:membrane protein insertase YidC [Patescibacteria group bacterium]
MNIFEILLLQPLANGLILFYRLLGENMGVAIIGFSLFLRVLLNPLTKPYMKSMKKMKDVAPQLEKLKKRHKEDKGKLRQAQADLYKQRGVNPAAGCLPYILQIVVLIAFFNVFVRTLSSGPDAVSKFNELLYPPLQFDQEQTINTRFLYLDVTEPDAIEVSFLPFPLPGPILILAAVVQLISAKIMAPYIEIQEKRAKATPEKTDDIASAMQKSTTFMIPVFTIIFGLRFASGLALYWLLFSLYQAYQQYRMSGWGGMTPFLKKTGLLKS